MLDNRAATEGGCHRGCPPEVRQPARAHGTPGRSSHCHGHPCPGTCLRHSSVSASLPLELKPRMRGMFGEVYSTFFSGGRKMEYSAILASKLEGLSLQEKKKKPVKTHCGEVSLSVREDTNTIPTPGGVGFLSVLILSISKMPLERYHCKGLAQFYTRILVLNRR